MGERAGRPRHEGVRGVEPPQRLLGRRGTPKSAGLILGAWKGGHGCDSSISHAFCGGRTGSRKTSFQVLTSLRLATAAWRDIVTAGEPEVLGRTGGRAREFGCAVVVLDFSVYPGVSWYGLLSLVAGHIGHYNWSRPHNACGSWLPCGASGA